MESGKYLFNGGLDAQTAVKLLDDVKPEYLAVAFDVKHPTKRHEMYKDYKGTRKGMPDELAAQMPIIKKVLEAMFKQVKKMNVTKLPKVVEMVLSECQTSLSNNDIMSMGVWAMSSNPTIEDLSIPNKNIKSRGQIIRGGWYYVYDLDVAKKEIKNFILETTPKSETEDKE